MKRRIFLVLIIVIAALAIVVVASGNGSRNPDKDLTAKATKVAAIFNGEPDDMGWGQAQYTALEDVKEELNLDITYSFCVDFTDEESARAAFDKAISDGSAIVYTNSYDFVDWVKEYSERYPEVYFLSCAGSYNSGNVATFFGRIYQMRYLSGIVAGLTTETNHIGYVAAVPIPEVVRGINAFALGVQSVNPDAVVHVGWSGDWVNADKAHEQAVLLLDKYPIDVMTQHHDALDPIIEADSRGVYTIGYNVDQSEMAEKYLTAPVWNWQPIMTELVLSVLSGDFEGKNYWEGIDSGIVSLAEFTDNVPAEAEAAVEEARSRMLEGEWDVFYGPIYDCDGVLRISEGEKMSDRQLLEDFDWFVMGVDANIDLG